MLPPGHQRLKLKTYPLFHANNKCEFDAEIKSYTDGKTILIYHNHYLPCTYNSKFCRYVCNCYYYDRAVHISVAVDMRTLLDRKNFSSSSNGQVAAHRVTAYYQKAFLTLSFVKLYIFIINNYYSCKISSVDVMWTISSVLLDSSSYCCHFVT